jgi:hypothetical protein
LKEKRLPVPHKNPNPIIIIQNEQEWVIVWIFVLHKQLISVK